mmetsp:Transcript_36147/g.78114  ORF Transcript_36147/g.78114 Transcript_36147/m.78114 type:complete len:177 (+) Transcript_36147:708-1238(+)
MADLGAAPDDADNGVYYLEWDIFTRFFCEVSVVMCFPKLFPCMSASGRFGADVRGQPSASQCVFLLRPNHERVWLQLEQCDVREHRGQAHLRAMALIVTSKDGQTVCESSALEVARTVGLVVELNPKDGPFKIEVFSLLVGTATHPSDEFWLTAWSSLPLQLQLLGALGHEPALQF